MGALVVTCEGCGVRLRIARPDSARSRACPRCETALRGPIDRADAEAAHPSIPLVPISIETPPLIEPKQGLSRRGVVVQAILSAAFLVAALTYTLASRRLAHHSTTVLVAGRSQTATDSPSTFPLESSPSIAADRQDPREPRATDPSADPTEVPLVTSGPPPTPEPPPPDESDPNLGTNPATPPVPKGPVPVLAMLPLRSRAEVPSTEPRRILARDEEGRPVVTRVYVESDRNPVVLLPDGQIRWTEGEAFTQQPFRAATADEVRSALEEGPYRDFKVLPSEHYLVFYRCSPDFAAKSAHLLDSLYVGLKELFQGWDLDVHDSEFPMVAVIYDTERAFREHNPVPPDVQAFYHTLSNRIFFYESADREQASPEVAAIRKPQTVAHEGTHQILANIGVQPRLARWPIWLTEGLAEYCAPTFTLKGANWAGIGQVNPLHMATIHDLHEQSDLQRVRGMPATDLGYDFRKPFIAYLVTKTELTPTDYALSWALTHFLAARAPEKFRSFLQAMSRMSPADDPGPDDQLRAFREAFGDDLARTARLVGEHLGGLRYVPLPYYAVILEQSLGGGMVRKAALVSQSPSTIRQWLDSMPTPGDLPYNWRAFPYPTSRRAQARVEDWMNQP